MAETTGIEWGFVTVGKRGIAETIWLRMKLHAGIVFREWHTGRVGPVLAWQICGIIHPWREPVREWREFPR